MSYERLRVPTMAGGGGSIINFASVAAPRGTEFAGMLAQSAAKGAVLAMPRQLAVAAPLQADWPGLDFT
jgi:NAD(P)-dependent dehydrogenase (short-subunit alcohol dehydrogenase family)